jgi:hypothetical protein
VLLASIALAIVMPTAPAKKVLVIGVDGCRPDALTKATTPYIDGLIRNGCWAVGRADPLTLSGPCWSTVLCGAGAKKHGVTDDGFVGANFREYPDFLTLIERSRPSLRTVAVAEWKPLVERIVRTADYKGRSSGKGDEATALEASTQIADFDPDVVFVHFGAVEEAGHAFGYGPSVTQYLRAIEETDKNVGLLLAAVRSRKNALNEDWLVILTSDHGGSGTSHGAAIPDHINVPFIVSGPSSADGFDVIPALVDVAPTVFAHLGIRPGDEVDWDGIAVGLSGLDSAALVRARDDRTVKFQPTESLLIGVEGITLLTEDETVETRITTDGTLPTSSSRRATGLVPSANVLVRARAFRDGKPAGPSSAMYYQVQRELLPPVQLPRGGIVESGLEFKVVRGEFWRTSGIDFSKPVKSGVTAKPTEKVAGLSENFAIEFVGLVMVTEPGSYKFGVYCDDGGRLWVDDQLVADHDGSHKATMQTGLIGLKTGWHRFRLVYFQRDGDFTLSVAVGLVGRELSEPKIRYFGH